MTELSIELKERLKILRRLTRETDMSMESYTVTSDVATRSVDFDVYFEDGWHIALLFTKWEHAFQGILLVNKDGVEHSRFMVKELWEEQILGDVIYIKLYNIVNWFIRLFDYDENRTYQKQLPMEGQPMWATGQDVNKIINDYHARKRKSKST